jgi:hypothetical protein
MPLSESAQAEARSLILRLRPGASDKCISAVYSLSDMPWPASKSASRARGTVSAARDHARRNASSPALSGATAGPRAALVMEPQYLLDEASATIILLDAATIYEKREP